LTRFFRRQSFWSDLGNLGGLKEAALLAKAWGVTNAIIVNTIIQGAYYFCGPERMDMAEEVLADVM
jgi:hypothetical protein